MQNSTAVFQLNISNKTSFCASISRHIAKLKNVSRHFTKHTSNIKELNYEHKNKKN